MRERTRMTPDKDTIDLYDLNRFVCAQEDIYDDVLTELKNGQKRRHWMWFIFPQIDGLGRSETAIHYAIKSEAEARRYLDHAVLGARLRECAETLLGLEGRSAADIFGFPDDLKLKSSMTLFASVAGPDSLFDHVLYKYFQREHDTRTLEILKKI